MDSNDSILPQSSTLLTNKFYPLKVIAMFLVHCIPNLTQFWPTF